MNSFDENINDRFIEICDNGNVEQVIKFVKKYLNNIHIDDGFTWASSHNNYDVVEYLLTDPAVSIYVDIHAKNHYAIRWACINKNNKIAQFLLSSEKIKEHASLLAAFESCYKSKNNEIIEYILKISNIDTLQQLITMYKESNIEESLIKRIENQYLQVKLDIDLEHKEKATRKQKL